MKAGLLKVDYKTTQKQKVRLHYSHLSQRTFQWHGLNTTKNFKPRENEYDKTTHYL